MMECSYVVSQWISLYVLIKYEGDLLRMIEESKSDDEYEENEGKV